MIFDLKIDEIWKSFHYQTSKVDWCEENFRVSEYIAEFFNTVSESQFFFMIQSKFCILWVTPYSKSSHEIDK